jgi:hypothetical protein
MVTSLFRLVNLKESIISSNTSTSKIKKQHRKKYLFPLASDPIKEFHHLSELEAQAMSIIIWFSNNCNSIYFKQEWLAKQLKITRQTANKVLSSLRERGYINSEYRHMTSCVYKISDYFLFMPVREALSHLINAFKYVSLSVITASILHSEIISKFRATQVKSPFVYIKSLSHWISKGGGLSTKKVVKKSKDHVAHRKRKGFSMNNPILPEIMAIASITMHEKIQLSAFPREAIIYALKAIRQSKNIKSVFKWLRFVCKDYCSCHGLEPDYEWASQLERAYKSKPEQFSVVASLSTTPKPTSQTYQIQSQKREGKKYSAQEQAIYDKYKFQRKAFVNSLPPASEEVMRSMAAFFPGTKEELEKLITEHSKEAIAKRQTQAYTEPQKHQPLKKEDTPKQKCTTHTNEDSLKQMIWGMAI